MMTHFNITEFECPCCKQRKMNFDFLELLDKARDLAGIPFIVTSGYRCEKHNKEIHGKKDSAHLRGYAADIFCNDSKHRQIILRALLLAGFRRIGVAKDFIHADSDPNKVPGVVWLYD